MIADQQLEHRLRAACARLELVAWGNTPTYNSSGSRSSEHPGGRQPGQPPIIWHVRHDDVIPLPADPQHYRHEYTQATTYMQRLAVVERAEQAAEVATAPPRRTGQEGSVTVQQLIVEDDRGWPPASIAKVRGVTESQVRRWRQQASMHPETGEPFDDDANAVAAVLRLHDGGGTRRQIAFATGISKSTVDRIVQRHRQDAA